MSSRYFKGYGSTVKKNLPVGDTYANQMLSMLKKEMQKVDSVNAKRLDEYRRSSHSLKEKHGRLLQDVHQNLTKFKSDYDTVKQRFRTETESTRNLKKELAQSLSERKNLQARLDDLLQHKHHETNGSNHNKNNKTHSAGKKRKTENISSSSSRRNFSEGYESSSDNEDDHKNDSRRGDNNRNNNNSLW